MFKRVFLGSMLLLLTACATTTTTNTNEPVITETTETTTETTAQGNNAAANYNVQLGVGYLQQGDVQRAKHKLLTAMDQAPKSAPAHEAMGYFLENTGDTPAAEKYYLKAIELEPQAGSAHNNYGTYLCRQKRYQEADKQFMLAVEDKTYLNAAAAYENAGICAMEVPDYPKAAGYFQKVILQDPKRPAAYLQLGQIYFKEGDFAKAQQNLDQYMKLNTEPGPDALWLGVRLARNQKDNITAGKYAMILQTKYPNSPEFKQLRATQPVKSENQEKALLKLGW